MDVQTEKIELAKKLLETDDEELLQQLKIVFENHSVSDELPLAVKEGINRSLAQAREGRLTAHDEVMSKYAKYL